MSDVGFQCFICNEYKMGGKYYRVKKDDKNVLSCERCFDMNSKNTEQLIVEIFKVIAEMNDKIGNIMEKVDILEDSVSRLYGKK